MSVRKDRSGRGGELGPGLGWTSLDKRISRCARSHRMRPGNRGRTSVSHQQGTFLDLVLEDVDHEAKAQALQQPHPITAGYLAGLQVPQPAFCRNGVQWHDTDTVQCCQLRQLYTKQQEVLHAPEVASYAYYATCVASSSLSWGDRLRMVTFRQELGSVVATRCAFCDNVVTASHFQETCRCSQLWYAVLHAPMAPDLRRIVLAWSVSLPTCWGVLVQWGGAYLGITTQSAPVCPVPHVSWMTLSLIGRVPPASEKAMIRHGATPQQARKFFVAFWKAVLRMSCAAHPPQLRNEGNWARLGYTLVAFDYLYPARDFLAAGHWHLQPPESSSVPPALHLHLWHRISGVSIYVRERRMAHHGTGDVLYWFHSGSHLADNARWPRFVQQRPVLCRI